jgi:hypothetical protein
VQISVTIEYHLIRILKLPIHLANAHRNTATPYFFPHQNGRFDDWLYLPNKRSFHKSPPRQVQANFYFRQFAKRRLFEGVCLNDRKREKLRISMVISGPNIVFIRKTDLTLHFHFQEVSDQNAIPPHLKKFSFPADSATATGCCKLAANTRCPDTSTAHEFCSNQPYKNQPK